MLSLWRDHTSLTTNPGVQVKRKISFSTLNRNLIMWLPGSWHSQYIGLLPSFLLTKPVSFFNTLLWTVFHNIQATLVLMSINNWISSSNPQIPKGLAKCSVLQEHNPYCWHEITILSSYLNSLPPKCKKTSIFSSTSHRNHNTAHVYNVFTS